MSSIMSRNEKCGVEKHRTEGEKAMGGIVVDGMIQKYSIKKSISEQKEAGRGFYKNKKLYRDYSTNHPGRKKP